MRIANDFRTPVGRIDLRRIPLVVGVTGHRNIAVSDEGDLRAAFAGILRELAAKCPSTQIVVLSSLATGVDVLAAEEAIAHGVPVIAVLPMSAEAYEEDFSETQRARFRSVLGSCARITVASSSGDRKTAYVATGLFLVHYSHVLVAFWDGRPGRGPGGTADIVRMRTSGDTSHIDDIATFHYFPDTGPVYHVITPRNGTVRPDDAYTVRRIYPSRFEGDQFAERDTGVVLQRFGVYNADLVPLGQQTDTPPLNAGNRSLRERTDAIADRLQRTTNEFQFGLYFFGFFAAFAQIFLQPYLKVIGIIVAFLSYWLARRYDYENRYQDYRALAEGLRVQEAWHFAGLEHEWVDACYLNTQQNELQWIRMALRCTSLLYCEDALPTDANPQHEFCRGWIDSQWTYYKKRAADQACRRSLIRLSSTAVVAAGAALAVLVGLIVDPLLVPPWLFAHGLWRGGAPVAPPWSQDTIHLLLELQTAPIAIGALIGTLLWQWSEQRSYGANARRYQRMFVVFDRAKTRLERIGSDRLPETRSIIRELGREALIEHAEWLLARRDRPLSIAHV